MSQVERTIGLVKYPPETVCEALIPQLAANQPYAYVNAALGGSGQGYLITLKTLLATRNANMQHARIRGALFGRRYERTILGNVLPLVDFPLPIEVPFYEELFVDLLSTAIIANYQAHVTYEVRSLSVADKVSLGATEAAMSDEELALSERFNIPDKVKRGVLPMQRPLGTLIAQEVHSAYQALAANGWVNVGNIAVKPGEKVVLRRLWTLRPAANPTQLIVTVEREQAAFLQAWPHVLSDYNTVVTQPLELYIPALQRMRVSVTSTAGHLATDVGVVAEYDIRSQTIWDKIAWGLPKTSEEKARIEEQDLESLYNAGIYSLSEAWTHEHAE